VWFGVEWDDPGRGKHDGTTGGTQYFVCPVGQGSFVKERKIDAKVSLSAALVYRYCGGASGGDAAECVLQRSLALCAALRACACACTHAGAAA
jgi:hypothetical protein